MPMSGQIVVGGVAYVFDPSAGLDISIRYKYNAIG